MEKKKNAKKPCEQNEPEKEPRSEQEVELILHAMEVYLQEYIHRDTHMWSQNFKFFYASLIVTLLPYLGDRLGITLPVELNRISVVFPIIGIFLAILFMYTSYGLTNRFRAVSDTYMRLAQHELPKYLQLTSIRDLDKKDKQDEAKNEEAENKEVNENQDASPKKKEESALRKKMHTFFIPIVMFLGLIAIATISIVFTLVD